MSNNTTPVEAPRQPGGLWITRAAVAVLLLVLAAIFAYFSLFSMIAPYDDEGYLMMTTKHFIDGGVLYDEVPAQYGPLYYGVRLLIHGAAGVPLTNENVRLITMITWLATSVVVALVAGRLTRHASLAVITFVATFLYQDWLGAEPNHPQELVGLLLALTVAIATWLSPERPWRISAALGAAVACLIMTKINVGIFAALSLSLALMLAVEGRLSRLATVALWILAVAMPFVLIRRHLAASWGLSLALLIALSITSLVIAASAGPRSFRARPISILGAYVSAAFATTILLILIVVSRGSSLYGMIDGLVLMPVRISTTLVEPSKFSMVSVCWAMFSAMLAVLYWRQARRSAGSPALEFASVLGKAALGFYLIVTVTERPFIKTASAFNTANFVTPFLWLILIPPRSSGASGVFPRLALALVAALQLLAAFPIAGGQLIFGTFLDILIEAVCLGDTADWAERRFAAETFADRMARKGLLVVAVFIVAFLGRHAIKQYRIYHYFSVPLVGHDVRGASRIHCPEQYAATNQWLIANLTRYSDTFLCTTGQNSLYFWTQIAPPTKIVIGNGLDLFPVTDENQKLVVQALLRSPRSCVIYHPMHFEKTYLPVVGPPGRILKALREEFTSCGKVDNYSFCVRVGRELPTLVDCVRPESPSGQQEIGATPKFSGAVLLTAVPGRTACRFSICDLAGWKHKVLADTRAGGATPWLDVGATNTPVPFRPSDPAGLDLSSPHQLTIAFPMTDPAVKEHFLVLELIDRDGRLIKAIPFADAEDLPIDAQVGSLP